MGKKISELTEINSAPSDAYTVIEHGGQNYKVKPSGFSGGGGGLSGAARFQVHELSQPAGSRVQSSHGGSTSFSWVPLKPELEVVDAYTGSIFQFGYPTSSIAQYHESYNFIDGPIDSAFDMFYGGAAVTNNQQRPYYGPSMIAIINLAYGNTTQNKTNPAAYVQQVGGTNSASQFFTNAGLSLDASNNPNYTAHPIQIMDGSSRTASSLSGNAVLAYKNPDGKLFYIPTLHTGSGNPGVNFYFPHREFWALMWSQVYKDFLTAVNILDL